MNDDDQVMTEYYKNLILFAIIYYIVVLVSRLAHAVLADTGASTCRFLSPSAFSSGTAQPAQRNGGEPPQQATKRIIPRPKYVDQRTKRLCISPFLSLGESQERLSREQGLLVKPALTARNKIWSGPLDPWTGPLDPWTGPLDYFLHYFFLPFLDHFLDQLFFGLFYRGGPSLVLREGWNAVYHRAWNCA